MSNKYISGITADSQPVYGWLWDYWDAQDWTVWHMRLEERYGLTDANKKFLEAWEDSPAFASNFNYRTFDDDFIAYAKEKDFYEGLFPGIAGSLMRWLNAGGDVIKTVPKAVTNVANSIDDLSRYIVPLALVLGIFYLYNKLK